MKTNFVVTGVVKHNDKLLILKRSPKERNYPNRWSFCSGFAKEFEPAEETCIREIKEETNLNTKIVKTGKIIEKIDREKNIRWVIAVYLCETNDKDVKLCHENVDFKWVTQEELEKYDLVPGLSKDLDSLGL